MLTRNQHHQDVLDFLQTHFAGLSWKLDHPSSGRGHETYIAIGNGGPYFIKLGVDLTRYSVMTTLDLTPPIIQAGFLADRTSILVQPYISSRHPTWTDFRHNLTSIAEVVNKMHHSQDLQKVLPGVNSERYHQVGLAAFNRLEQKWLVHRSLVPSAVGGVEKILVRLKEEIQQFAGEGLVASHNDICNANWLITSTGKIYLVDLEAMTREDPAHDLGSLLWWYYPPALRAEFLAVAGYPYDSDFQHRMQIRMTMHCLDILLPRPNSYDRFDAGAFSQRLEDFLAVSQGKQNPHGYQDASS